jgi:hypothetical protein
MDFENMLAGKANDVISRELGVFLERSQDCDFCAYLIDCFGSSEAVAKLDNHQPVQISPLRHATVPRIQQSHLRLYIRTKSVREIILSFRSHR